MTLNLSTPVNDAMGEVFVQAPWLVCVLLSTRSWLMGCLNSEIGVTSSAHG